MLLSIHRTLCRHEPGLGLRRLGDGCGLWERWVFVISLSRARELKEAGLVWKPASYDFFGIPDRGMDEHVFVINDITVLVEQVMGHVAVTFHGTPEWALDYVMVTEVVWLPTEAQLREALEEGLLGEPQPSVTFQTTLAGYRCVIRFQGQVRSFESFGASETYAAALLHVLKNRQKV